MFVNCISKLLVILLAIQLAQGAKIDGCQIQLSKDITTTDPVFLQKTSNGLELLDPTGDVTLLKSKSQLSLACTGKTNTLAVVKEAIANLQCRNGDEFTTENGKTISLDSLLCQKVPEADIVETDEKCSQNRGHIFNIGFNVNNDFVTLFKLCYNNTNQHTFYATHTVNGAIKYSVKDTARKAFRANAMGLTTTYVNKLYTKGNQIEKFEKLFGKDQKYANNTMFLARGHLSPDADFVFSYSQLATYFYANVAPEFQIINSGNWVRIENLVRSTAIALDTELTMFTGHIDTLELPDKKGNLIPVYLDDDNLFNVPKFIYKVIMDKSSDSAVVLVTSNNPFAKSGEVKEFCTNVCDAAGINIATRTDNTRGYTFCCKLSDFTKIVKDLPTDLAAKNLLKVPSA